MRILTIIAILFLFGACEKNINTTGATYSYSNYLDPILESKANGWAFIKNQFYRPAYRISYDHSDDPSYHFSLFVDTTQKLVRRPFDSVGYAGLVDYLARDAYRSTSTYDEQGYTTSVGCSFQTWTVIFPDSTDLFGTRQIIFSYIF